MKINIFVLLMYIPTNIKHRNIFIFSIKIELKFKSKYEYFQARHNPTILHFKYKFNAVSLNTEGLGFKLI